MLPDNSLQAALLDLLKARLPLVAVIRKAGFPGVAPFAKAISAQWNVQPGALQGWQSTGHYRVDYNGPFNLDQMLRYLGRDPENLAERVQGKTYRRLLPLDGHAIAVSLTFDKTSCTVEARRPRRAEAALALHAMVRRFLGLEQPLVDFYQAVGQHRVFAPLVSRFAGARIPQVPTLWEALCWAVVGQQINLAFAYKLRNRLIALGNGISPKDTSLDGPPLPFPSPEQVLRLTPEALRTEQFSRQKSAYVLGLAKTFADGVLDEETLRRLPAEDAEEVLIAQKGLGPWSVAYALMRSLGHPDALPVGDAGLRAALRNQFRLREPPDVKRQAKLMEPFRPYRSLATYYLWKSLSVEAGN